MAQLPWVKIFGTSLDMLLLLTEESAGRVIHAVARYSKERELPEGLDNTESIVFDRIRENVDDSAENYSVICRRNKKNAKKASGNPVATQWEPSGNPVATQWEPSGNPVATQWEPSGANIEVEVEEEIEDIKEKYKKENANGSSRGAVERGGTVPEADKETAKEQIGSADGAMQVLAELQRMGFSLQRNAAKEVGAYVARLGKGRVLAAVDNAAGREKRSWAYVRAILDSGGAAGADSKNRVFQLSGRAPGGLGTKAARRMLAQDTEEAET